MASTTWSHEELYSMEELESYLMEYIGDDSLDRIVSTELLSPSDHIFMGEDEFATLMEEHPPMAQPLKAEVHLDKLEDVRVEDSGSVCSICLDEMQKDSIVKRFPCCHMYHRNCIGEWLSKRNNCPLCRHQLPAS